MRLALLFFLLPWLGLAARAGDAAPTELEAALRIFRTDPPPGWSFTQKSVGAGESLVERCDATRPVSERWSLLEKDGHAPTAAESLEYNQNRSPSRSSTAPRITDQLDLTTARKTTGDARTTTFQCRLRKLDAADGTSPHLLATIVVDNASRAVARLELSNTEPFSPALGVKIAEMKTVLSYSLPSAEQPGLPQTVTTRVRGRAFWFKSLDEDMIVTFSSYERGPRK